MEEGEKVSWIFLLVVDLLLAEGDAAVLVQQVLPGRRLGRIQLLHVGRRDKALPVIDLHLPPVLQQGRGQRLERFAGRSITAIQLNINVPSQRNNG